MRVLNVAEKNDAAKNIASILSRGASNRREGLSKFNKIYEFRYDAFGQACQMVMTSVSGHLLSLDFPAPYTNWQNVDIVQLFDAPVQHNCPQNYKSIQHTLEREARSCQKLVIWTDCDREGENIGFEIIGVCLRVNRHLDVWRARFSEITSHACNQAMRNLQRPDERISRAVECRSELDLRIGAAFTRILTMRFRDRFGAFLGEKKLLSYGSCQFPTLGFVVERYKEIQRFIREDFWRIRVLHNFTKPEKMKVEFIWQRVRLFDELACQILLDVCQESPQATVVSVTQKPRNKWRPLPLDTVQLEKLASRILKINAKQTMKIAEKLYSQGFISYPRTETNIFPAHFNLPELLQAQTGDQRWGAFAQQVLHKGPNPRRGSKSDQAHPPIHPIKHATNLQGNEWRIYELITRHFLATCSEDAKGQETSIHIDIAAERFHAEGLVVTDRGYLEVYPYDKWESKKLPVLPVGHKFIPSKIEMVSGQTSAPALLSEADLIALMEKYGIGTDATHAEHIETIQERLYAGMTPERRFMPGRVGMGLVEGFDAINHSMSRPHLRAQLEASLKDICEGRRSKQEVLHEQIDNYRAVFLQVRHAIDTISQALGRCTQL
ncbi:DNA topoisomerase 3-alpha-like [Paramacrobiotus metropolitanus]|uniref:DNA topoisomerase 3-alpha-like n=1 Tax=Paramacrobiotus metropolitanus TaxID=2943436 RepID=UPI002445AE26|nr:DNA topoisomerase 3-alpha-like [Paramacrobiotus metropolitanus]